MDYGRFGHLVRNCRNQRIVQRKRRLEYENNINNGQNNLNGKESLVVLDQALNSYDKVSREVWKTVEAKIGKVRIVKTKERKKKVRREEVEEGERKEKEKKATKEEENRSKEVS